MNSGIAPTRVIAGHPHNQPFDFGCGLGTTRAASPTAIVFLGDQPPVPAKQCVWRDQSADFEEPFAADRLGPRCESTALSIGEEQAPIAELFAEHSVLRLQVLDDILLTAIHPSGEDHHQKLKLQVVHPREGTPAREFDSG